MDYSSYLLEYSLIENILANRRTELDVPCKYILVHFNR
jgi:hypothetical protein